PPHRSRGADEGAQGAEGIGEAGQRLVPVEPFSSGGRRLSSREPPLEVHVPDLQPSLRSMVLGVHAPDELPVVQDGEGVVAVHALVAGGIDLDAVVEAEKAGPAGATRARETGEANRRARAASCPWETRRTGVPERARAGRG